MTGTKRTSHQKRYITRRDYNRQSKSLVKPVKEEVTLNVVNNVVNPYKRLAPIIRVESAATPRVKMEKTGNDDKSASSNVVSPPDIIRRTNKRKNNNLERVRKKKRKTTYFNLTEDSFHANLRNSRIDRTSDGPVALNI